MTEKFNLKFVNELIHPLKVKELSELKDGTTLWNLYRNLTKVESGAKKTFKEALQEISKAVNLKDVPLEEGKEDFQKLLWKLIQHFVIVPKKDKVLELIEDCEEGNSLKESMENGLLPCVLSKFDNDLLVDDFQDPTKRAIEIAQERYEIPSLIDTQDFTDYPEDVFLVYLTFVYDMYQAKKSKKKKQNLFSNLLKNKENNQNKRSSFQHSIRKQSKDRKFSFGEDVESQSKFAPGKDQIQNLKTMYHLLVCLKERYIELTSQKELQKQFELIVNLLKDSNKKKMLQMIDRVEDKDPMELQTLSIYLEQFLFEKYVTFKTDNVWKEIQKVKKMSFQRRRSSSENEISLKLGKVVIPPQQMIPFRTYLEKNQCIFELDLKQQLFLFKSKVFDLVSNDELVITYSNYFFEHCMICDLQSCRKFVSEFMESSETYSKTKKFNPYLESLDFSLFDDVLDELTDRLKLENTDFQENPILKKQKRLLQFKIIQDQEFIKEKQEIKTIQKIQEDFENELLKKEKDESEMSPEEKLIESVKQGDFQKFLDLVKDVSSFTKIKDKTNKTLLHFAVTKSVQITEYLIQNGADVDAEDKSFRSPIFLSCVAGNRDTTMFLLGNKCKVNLRDEIGLSPLGICLRKGNFEIADDLLLFKANINFKRDNGSNLLHEAVLEENLSVLLWILKQSNVALNSKDVADKTALIRSAYSKNPQLMIELLKAKGIDTLIRDSKNRNLIHILIQEEKIDHLKYFNKLTPEELKNYDKLFNEKLDGETFMHLAVKTKNYKLFGVAVLLANKLEIDYRSVLNENEETPLDVSKKLVTVDIDEFLEKSTKDRNQITGIIKICQYLEQENLDDKPYIEQGNSKAINQMCESVKVNTGHTLAELSKKHRLCLITIKWFGCPLCQELIERVAQMFLGMLQLNTIPIIGHQQNNETASHFFKNSKHPIVKQLLYTKIGVKEREVLELKNAPLSEHFKTMGSNLKSMIYDKRYFQAPLDVIAPLTCFGVFLIEDSSITKKLIYENFTKRFNFGMFLQEGNYQTDKTSNELLKDFSELFNDFSLKDLKKITNQIVKLDEQEKVSKDIKDELGDFLKDEFKRYYFKAFATNEFCSESLMLFEEILQYKIEKNKRQKLERIYSNYISDGISFVELPKKLIEPLQNLIVETKEECKIDLFDEIELELKNGKLLEIFGRFKKSNAYQELNQKKSTIAYFI